MSFMFWMKMNLLSTGKERRERNAGRKTFLTYRLD
jgi:hypothetical protein